MAEHSKDKKDHKTKPADHKPKTHSEKKPAAHKPAFEVHHIKHKSKKQNDELYNKIFMGLGAVILILIVFNAFQINTVSTTVEDKIEEAKEAARPALLQLTVITDANCPNCYDINPLIEAIEGQNVNVTEKNTLDIADATSLIGEYEITRIPAVIIEGETKKFGASEFTEVGENLLFDGATPPYTEVESGSIVGLVDATIIEDPTCESCISLEPIIEGMKQFGITINEEDTIVSTSTEAKRFISDYDIEVLPALIFSNDLDSYGEDVTATWEEIGTVEYDGSFVTRKNNPPFVDLKEGRIVGLVSMVTITDETCVDCYSPESFHKPILQRMGIAFESEEIIDISSPEGDALITQYNIDKVPTIILTGDVEEYPVLVQAWTSVGTKEDDGAYIFRDIAVTRNTYRDLASGEVVSS